MYYVILRKRLISFKIVVNISILNMKVEIIIIIIYIVKVFEMIIKRFQSYFVHNSLILISRLIK